MFVVLVELKPQLLMDAWVLFPLFDFVRVLALFIPEHGSASSATSISADSSSSSIFGSVLGRKFILHW